MLGRKNDSPKILDVDASLQGNLTFKDAVNLHINGNFEGRLETRGDLLIGERAVVRANIIGERIAVAGSVTGDLTAVTEIKLTASAKVNGNIQTPSLTIEKGATFQGQSRMTDAQDATKKETGARNVFFTPDEVARYLSVETSVVSRWAENGNIPGSKESGQWRFDKQRIDQWIANGRVSS